MLKNVGGKHFEQWCESQFHAITMCQCSEEFRTCTLIVAGFTTILFIGGGITFLKEKAGPDLSNYLDKEQHFIYTVCNVQQVGISKKMNCSYVHQFSCLYQRYCARQINKSYDCVRVLITYKHLNATVVQARLFRTSKDAELTRYECSAYECENADMISKFVKTMKSEDSFGCHYHPSQPQYVYVDTNDAFVVMISFIFAILLILAPFACCATVLCTGCLADRFC